LLEPHVKRELIEKLHCQFHEMYGTSEVSTATNINFTQVSHKTKTVGKCLEESQIRIVDDAGNQLPIGEVGEITVKSLLAFKGYYGMPEKTAASYTADGFFHTGDLGKLDEDGYLYFCGRKKELIITGGINVYPPDIEECLQKIPGVAECAAFAYPDERLGEIVAVAIVKEEGAQLTSKAVQFHCARNLADFQQPHKIFFLAELPRNAMGKLVKGKLYETVKKNAEVEA
jgi:acyl-CoA synthetase (AMP-forming)/AMP-acid ligase II